MIRAIVTDKDISIIDNNQKISQINKSELKTWLKDKPLKFITDFDIKKFLKSKGIEVEKILDTSAYSNTLFKENKLMVKNLLEDLEKLTAQHILIGKAVKLKKPTAFGDVGFVMYYDDTHNMYYVKQHGNIVLVSFDNIDLSDVQAKAYKSADNKGDVVLTVGEARIKQFYIALIPDGSVSKDPKKFIFKSSFQELCAKMNKGLKSYQIAALFETENEAIEEVNKMLNDLTRESEASE